LSLDESCGQFTASSDYYFFNQICSWSVNNMSCYRTVAIHSKELAFLNEGVLHHDFAFIIKNVESRIRVVDYHIVIFGIYLMDSEWITVGRRVGSRRVTK